MCDFPHFIFWQNRGDKTSCMLDSITNHVSPFLGVWCGIRCTLVILNKKKEKKNLSFMGFFF